MTVQQGIRISVIIPTFKGAARLPKIIQALEAQTHRDFETLIIVDGSPDASLEVLENLKTTLKDLRWISQENRGRAGARNRGAMDSKGELLIFFDDDTRPQPDCVAAHLAHHRQFGSSLLTANVPEEESKMKSDFQKYKAFLSRKWVAPLNTPHQPLTEKTLFLTAANFSLPKKIFEQIGGFDAELNDCEDFDLGVRAFQAGYPVFFNPHIIAWHDDLPSCRAYILRQRQYRVAFQKLKEKKPELYLKFSGYEYNVPTGLKRMIYRFFARKFFVVVIDGFNWLKIFPKKIRYRFYDIITTALAIHFPEREIGS